MTFAKCQRTFYTHRDACTCTNKLTNTAEFLPASAFPLEIRVLYLRTCKQTVH